MLTVFDNIKSIPCYKLKNNEDWFIIKNHFLSIGFDMSMINDNLIDRKPYIIPNFENKFGVVFHTSPQNLKMIINDRTNRQIINDINVFIYLIDKIKYTCHGSK